MSFDRDRLLRLLPQVYAQRDAEIDGPLGDLLGVLAEQIQVLEADLDQLYDDQFIETCAEWAVPYIGDLIGYRTPHNISSTVGRARAEVAHTIDLRRRKGTVSALERLARDVTGWRSSAAEYFQRLITTQYMNHVRLHIAAAPDLRLWEPLEQVETAFDRIPRSIDVRRIASRRGKHNIPNVGLHSWRLSAYPLTLSPAPRVDTRRYRFHPLNIDAPLYTLPSEIPDDGSLANVGDVPTPISRRVLDARMAEYYPQPASNLVLSLRLYVDRNDGAGLVAVPIGDVCSCHLGDLGAGWAHLPPAGKFAVDPVLGRIGLPPEATNAWRVSVDFHYGFPADIGGGEYERAANFVELTAPPVRVPLDFPTIQQAINALGGSGTVIIENSGRYEETLTIAVNAGASIELRAADHWRPTIVMTGEMTITGGDESKVRLDGLLLTGNRVRVPAGANRLGELAISDCTLVPGWTLNPDRTPASPNQPSLLVEREELDIVLERSITGALRAPASATLVARNSAIDATSFERVAFAAADGTPGAELTLEGCTVVGCITAHRLLLISNCILLAQSNVAAVPPVHAQFRQEGCVRFTWLPANSRTPRRHECLPESAVDERAAQPRFTSLRYGDAGYCQLNVRAGVELKTGADDEAEPGVYHHLFNAWRETNLRVRLDEYLRVGLEAGIYFEN